MSGSAGAFAGADALAIGSGDAVAAAGLDAPDGGAADADEGAIAVGLDGGVDGLPPHPTIKIMTAVINTTRPSRCFMFSFLPTRGSWFGSANRRGGWVEHFDGPEPGAVWLALMDEQVLAAVDDGVAA